MRNVQAQEEVPELRHNMQGGVRGAGKEFCQNGMQNVQASRRWSACNPVGMSG